MAKTWGYLRVSTDRQDLVGQKYEVLEYCQTHKLQIDEFVEVTASTRRSSEDRRIGELFGKLAKGDTLVVSELSRLGRSLGEVVAIVDEIVHRRIRLVCIKQNWVVDAALNGEVDITTKILQAVFALLAELERDLISKRTRQALAAKRAQGVKLGRKQGSKNKTVKLDERRKEILSLLQDHASKSFIARKLRVSRSTLSDYMRSRSLEIGSGRA
jgi:DNA invertase Pin-like site-specific DNA recombinase